MDDRLPGPIRVALAAFAAVLLVGGVALAVIGGLEVFGSALAILGVIVAIVAAMGRPLSKFTATGAEWPERAAREIFRETKQGAFAADAVIVEPTDRAPTDARQHLDRSATDDVSGGSDSVQATVSRSGDYERRAASAKTPEEFARVVREAIEAEKQSHGPDILWEGFVEIGTGSRTYYFVADLFGMTAEQSRAVAEEAQRIADRTSPHSASVAGIFEAIAKEARGRAAQLPHRARANRFLCAFHSDADPEQIRLDRERAAALARESANHRDERVATFWRHIEQGLASKK